MGTIKTVGIRELKNHLSEYLREVQAGVHLLVTDRSRVIAEVRKPTLQAPLSDENPILRQWIEEGTIIPPTAPKMHFGRSPVRLPPGTAQKLLDEDRGE